MVVLSEITRKNYDSSLRRLRSGLNVPADAGLDFLKDFDRVSSWIDTLPLGLSSKKGYYVTIKVIAKNFLDNETLNKYDIKFKALADEANKLAMKQLTTPSESQKSLSWSKIISLKSKIEPIDGETNWNIIQDWVIYSLYTMMPPLRADYSPMRLFDKMPRVDISGNYLVLRKSSPVIILQEYKTFSKFGKVTIKIPSDLYDVLTVWRSLNSSEWLLLKSNGEPLTSDGLSQRVINIFLKHSGKAVGINILRHAYITMKRSGKELTLLQKESLAKQMLHSTFMNELYRRIDAE